MSLEEFKRAWMDLEVEESNRGFIVHFAIYVVINCFLIFINLYASPIYLWFPYPLAGWGVGLALHFAFSRRSFVVSKWEEKVAKIEARMRRMREAQG